MKYIILALFVSSLPFSAVAANLSTKFAAKNVEVSGSFSAALGKSVAVEGADSQGVPYKLIFMPKLEGKEFVRMSYEFIQSGQTRKGEVITKKGELAQLTSGGTKQKPDILFEAKFTE